MLSAPGPRPEPELEFDKANYIIQVLEKYYNETDDALFMTAILQLKDLLKEMANHKESTNNLMILEGLAKRRIFREGK
jgi:hypothetical protein